MKRGLLLVLVALLASAVTGRPPTVWAAEAEEKKSQEKKETKEKVEALPEMVITATKTERNPADVPASITIITSKEIERKNITVADEALEQVPGTFARRGKGWPDTRASVNLRGFPADAQKRTLILLDGQDLSSGYTNSVSWPSIPVEDIERIEVVRGPFSALYGGTAMGGVINIITKTPKKFGMQLAGGYGTYDSWMSYVSVGDRLWDKVSFQINYKYQVTNGYPSNIKTRTARAGAAATQVLGWRQSHSKTGSTNYIIGDAGDNCWFNHIVSGKVSWDVAPGHKVTFSTLFNWDGYGYGPFNTYLYNVATGAPVTTGTAGLYGSGLRFTSLREGRFLSGDGQTYTQVYNLNTEHRLRDTTILRFRGGLMNQSDNWYTTPTSSDPATTMGGGPGKISTSPSNSWNLEVQLDQQVGKRHLFTGGLVYKSSWASSKEYQLSDWKDISTTGLLTFQSQGRDSNFAFYLQDEISWHPKFTTVVGMRLDWWQTYEGRYQESATAPMVRLPSRSKVSFNPKFAVLYRPWKWISLRASVGTAFRPPNIYELYRTWRSSTGTLYKGNPDLKPETMVGWEFGATLKPFEGTTITTAIFQNFVYNLIYRNPDPNDPTGKTSVFQNAAQARIFGWELEITQKVCPWLDIFGNLTLMNPRITKNPFDPESVHKNITYVPRQQFNFGVNFHYWIINGNLTGRYVSKLYSKTDNSDRFDGVPGSYDPFFTLDAKVIVTPLKHLNPALGKSFISFAVNNILNRQYYYSYLTPGRTWWVQAGLKY